MKNLFIIDGTSGSGKSDMVEFVNNFRSNVSIIKKFTTRDRRPYEKDILHNLDLEFVKDENEFKNSHFDYVYKYGEGKYGFYKKDILNSLSVCNNVFIIVRNSDRIREIKREFSFLTTTAIFVYTDPTKVQERLVSEGLETEDILYRVSRTKEAFQDYVINSDLYDEIIINDSDRSTYHRLIDHIIKKYSNMPDIDENLIFVLRPFDDANENYRKCYLAIKRAVSTVAPHLKCKDLNEVEHGSPKISDTARHKIQSCRFAIVDLTDNRPNVFYELGYIHGIRKNVILISHVETSLLFYPKEYSVLRYTDSSDLENQLVIHLSSIPELSS